MTNDEIFEAEKLISDSISVMRDYLSRIASTKDAEEAVSVQKEYGRSAANSHIQLWAVIRRVFPQLLRTAPNYLGEVEEFRERISMRCALITGALYRFEGAGKDAKRVPVHISPEQRKAYRKQLIDAVAEYAPRANAALDKLAELLATAEPHPEEYDEAWPWNPEKLRRFKIDYATAALELGPKGMMKFGEGCILVSYAKELIDNLDSMFARREKAQHT